MLESIAACKLTYRSELTNKRTALETDISLLKCRYPFTNIRLLPLSCLTTLIILLQHLLQVRSLVEYLSCKLRVGNNLPVSVVLQGTGTDIQPLAHFLSRKEKLSGKEWLVRIRHFYYSFTYTSQR